MQFESKRNRTLWLTVTLGTIPDIVISIVVASVFSGGLLGFVASLLGLQVLYLLIWAKNSIWAWIAFAYLGGRKKLVAWLLDYFRENGYPEPNTHEKSADEYLASVADNENLPTLLRLKAASEMGVVKYLESTGQVQQSMRIAMALEDALEQFKRSFPPAPAHGTSQPTPASERG